MGERYGEIFTNSLPPIYRFLVIRFGFPIINFYSSSPPFHRTCDYFGTSQDLRPHYPYHIAFSGSTSHGSLALVFMLLPDSLPPTYRYPLHLVSEYKSRHLFPPPPFYCCPPSFRATQICKIIDPYHYYSWGIETPAWVVFWPVLLPQTLFHQPIREVYACCFCSEI